MRNASIWMYLLISCHPMIITYAAIIPPPWSDPNKNPCASLPGGWQLLYWPPLKQCFKIFQKGYPCPETMELSPVGVGLTSVGSTAECRCPPGTAHSPLTAKCHKLFEKGPCDLGQYFSPIADTPGKSAIPKQRWGVCKSPENCIRNMLFWPHDGKCYTMHTRGPCAKGKLLTLDNDGIARCKCDDSDLRSYYHANSETCHEHFKKGPCLGTGELFLPSRTCGCYANLPHFHNETNQCYEIGSVGPCPIGHVFIISEKKQDISVMKAECRCKEGYVLWNDGYCYKLYTKGPCEEGFFIVNSNECLENPCDKGRLYFPQEKTCYRIGSQGPCSLHQVVIFDFTTRPSIDGISHNGICGCSGVISNLDQTCSEDDTPKSACESTPEMVELNKQCYKLYSRGPCGPGQWLEPKKIPNRIRSATCQCRPGYTQYDLNTENGVTGCHAPSVGIARYLNGKNNKSYKFGFTQFASFIVDPS